MKQNLGVFQRYLLGKNNVMFVVNGNQLQNRYCSTTRNFTIKRMCIGKWITVIDDYCQQKKCRNEGKQNLGKSENCADKWICNFVLHYVAYGDMFIYHPNNIM